MNKFASLALAATLALGAVLPVSSHASEAAPATAVAGKMLYSANGTRVAAVYRVTQSGQVQIILEGQLVTVPASSLSEADGKLVTTLTKADLRKL
jgi:hypothetical protein